MRARLRLGDQRQRLWLRVPAAILLMAIAIYAMFAVVRALVTAAEGGHKHANYGPAAWVGLALLCLIAWRTGRWAARLWRDRRSN